MSTEADLPICLKDALRAVSDAISSKEVDGTSSKACFAELPSVLDRVRSDDHYLKVVDELRPGSLPARKPSPSGTDVDKRLDTKYTASLDALFGASVSLPGPITDMIAIFKGDSVPEGFVKVSKSVGGGIDADLNKSSGGRPIFLCVARNPTAAPVTAVAVVFGASGEFFPPGFQPVKQPSTGKPANFNTGTAGQEICLGLYRGQGSPVLDVGVWFPDRTVKPFNNVERVPPGHFVLKRTVLGHVANLNSSTRGPPIHLTVRKDLAHVHALFVGWKAVSSTPSEIRRANSIFVSSGSSGSIGLPEGIPTSESSRFSAPLASDADGDIDVAAESRTGSSTAELEGMTPAPEETVIADDADTTWAVQDDYTPGGRYSWIFASDDDIITTPTAQSAVLGALLAGLYHTRVSVVSACLVQLERLIHAGWFTKENWSRVGPPAAAAGDSTDYGAKLLEVAVASATDAVSTRPDMLYTELSSVVLAFVKRFGADVPAGGLFGMKSQALHRCVETMLRTFFFFSRKKLYSGRIARWAEASGRHRDLESLKRTFESARKDAISSRNALSELIKVLVTSVEYEFRPFVTTESQSGLLDSPTLAALVPPFKALLWSFRTVEAASASFCASIHLAASRVMVDWAATVTDRPEAAELLARYSAADPATLRSCAVDVLVTLGIICKIASQSLQVDADGNPRSVSDLQTKVAVLQLCGESISAAGEGFKHIAPLSYFLRRVVVPAVLNNCSEARIMLPSVFKAVLGCISSMWTHYRQSLKPELGVLANVIMLRTLSSPNSLPQQKSDVLAELRTWIQVPQDLVEMYLNFDNDAPYNHMRLVYHLVRALTSIACGSLNSIKIDSGDNTGTHEAIYVTAALQMQRDSIDMLESILRSVMDAAATVHLIANDAKIRKLSEVNWQWDVGSSRNLNSPPISRGHSRQSSVVMRHLTKKQLDEVLEEGMALCNTKSVGKGLKKLIDEGYLTKEPDDAVALLRLCGDRMPAREIGDFLGDIGRGEEEEKWYQDVRKSYMAGLDFTGMPFDVAFRYLLTNAGFFLPGEAQKIDRITQAFARAYCEMNEVEGISAAASSDPRLYRPSNPDVAEVLTFSLIMLHTDAHNPNIKKEKKMTMQQFVSNNRGIDGGKDLPRDFLEYLYTATVSHEIKMLPGAGSDVAAKGAATAGPQAFVGEITSSVYRALTHLSSLAGTSSFHRKNFSRDVVACMLEDIWPDIVQLMKYLAIERTDSIATEPAIASIALNLVKYATSAGLFLGLTDQVREAAEILEKVETRIMGRLSQPWQKTLTEPGKDGGVDALVASVHLTMADIASTATDVADKQNLAETAARFKQPFRKELESVPSRRVLYEGFLTKVCSNGRGKHKKYRFFLFTDILVYASTGAFSSMFTMHRCLPLDSISLVDAPDELASIPHCFRLNTDGKSIFLYADSEEEHMAWRRRIREAVRAYRQSTAVSVSQVETPVTGGSGAGETADRQGPTTVEKLAVMEEQTTYGFQGVAQSGSALVAPSTPAPSSSPSSDGTGVEATATAPTIPAPLSTLSDVPSPSSAPVVSAIPARIRNMTSKELKDAFRAALDRSRPMLQAPSLHPAAAAAAPSAGTLSDLQKLQFYGYFKQATKGDYTDADGAAPGIDAVERAKLEAWKKCKGLSRRDAMRAFVFLMFQVDPSWENRQPLETVPEHG